MAGEVRVERLDHLDLDTELRSAICLYLVGECREGATIGELARLELGGRPPAEEVARVSRELSQLVQDGEVRRAGERFVAV